MMWLREAAFLGLLSWESVEAGSKEASKDTAGRGAELAVPKASPCIEYTPKHFLSCVSGQNSMILPNVIVDVYRKSQFAET